jgi:hypothetical protein
METKLFEKHGLNEMENISSLICQICNSFMKDPKCCSECLEANFCSRCAEESFKKIPKCPRCNSKWSDTSFKTNPSVIKIYNTAEINCQKEGCDWRGKITDYFKHKEMCGQNVVKCSQASYGCKWSGSQYDEDEHRKKCLFNKNSIQKDPKLEVINQNIDFRNNKRANEVDLLKKEEKFAKIEKKIKTNLEGLKKDAQDGKRNLEIIRKSEEIFINKFESFKVENLNKLNELRKLAKLRILKAFIWGFLFKIFLFLFTYKRTR